MTPRFLLDTHIVIRWISDVKKLSRDQVRILDSAVLRKETLAVSAISLLEIALLTGEGGRLKGNADDLLDLMQTNPVFQILPLTFEIATEIASVGRGLLDSADRTIVATARVHRLRLLTSDQRIIKSKLAPVIE